MDINQRVDKLENEVAELRDSIADIQMGIMEIKVMLQERPKQEDLKFNLLNKDIAENKAKIQKMQDSQTWLWRTITGSIIGIALEAVAVIIQFAMQSGAK